MKIIQNIIVVIVLMIMFFSPNVSSSDKDVSEDALLKAAKRYMQVAPMSKIMEDSIREMSQSMPPEERNDFTVYMREVMREDMLEEIALDGMMKIFTAEELNALADFYGSTLGKSIMNKLGVYMAEVMPALQQELMRALETLQKEGKLQLY